MPFEVPEGWCWTTLADISNYGECINVPVDKIPDSSWILELEDIEKDSGRLIQRRIKSNKIINGVRHSFTKSNILYSKLRTYLNKVLIADQDGYCTTEIIPITCKKGIMPEYLCHVLRSSYYVGYTISLGYGVKMPRLGTTDALKSMIPVPPTSEQARIVSAIDKLSSTIDILEANQQDALDIADRTKAKILDLALTGKLVPQDPLDEPATRLLTRINPLYKSCDNRHYENIELSIPEPWCWATVGDVFKHNTGKALNSSNHSGIMMDYITTSNLYWDRFDLSTVKQMPFTEKDLEKCTVTKGDLLICEGGDVGRSAIWNYNYDIRIQNHIHRLRGKANICVRYFFYVFMLYKQRNYIGGKGVAIQGLSSRDLNRLVIPLPPLKEQYRIAKSVDNLFSTIDNILLEL